MDSTPQDAPQDAETDTTDTAESADVAAASKPAGRVTLRDLVLLTLACVALLASTWGMWIAPGVASAVLLACGLVSIGLAGIRCLITGVHEGKVLGFALLLPVLVPVALDLLGRLNVPIQAVDPQDPQWYFIGGMRNFPANARPDLSWGILSGWIGAYLCALSIYLGAGRKRHLRFLLGFGVVNAIGLGVWGALDFQWDHLIGGADAAGAAGPLRYGAWATLLQMGTFGGIWCAALFGLTLFGWSGSGPGGRIVRCAFFGLAFGLTFALVLLCPVVSWLVGSALCLMFAYFSLRFRKEFGASPRERMLRAVHVALSALFLCIAAIQGAPALAGAEPLGGGFSGAVQDSWMLVMDFPAWGWGAGSFQTVFALFKENDLYMVNAAAAPTSALDLLFAFGWGGALLMLLPLAWLSVRILGSYTESYFGKYLVSLAIPMAVLALFANPFAHPGIAFSALLLIFCGARELHLQESKDRGRTISSKRKRQAARRRVVVRRSREDLQEF